MQRSAVHVAPFVQSITQLEPSEHSAVQVAPLQLIVGHRDAPLQNILHGLEPQTIGPQLLPPLHSALHALSSHAHFASIPHENAASIPTPVPASPFDSRPVARPPSPAGADWLALGSGALVEADGLALGSGALAEADPVGSRSAADCRASAPPIGATAEVPPQAPTNGHRTSNLSGATLPRDAIAVPTSIDPAPLSPETSKPPRG